MRLVVNSHEREHLFKLFKHDTMYTVRGDLKNEIRKLRAAGLVKMRGNKTVGGMPEKTTFDLAEFVELTSEGHQFISRFTDQVGAETGDRGKTS